MQRCRLWDSGGATRSVLCTTVASSLVWCFLQSPSSLLWYGRSSTASLCLGGWYSWHSWVLLICGCFKGLSVREVWLDLSGGLGVCFGLPFCRVLHAEVDLVIPQSISFGFQLFFVGSCRRRAVCYCGYPTVFCCCCCLCFCFVFLFCYRKMKMGGRMSRLVWFVNLEPSFFSI